MILAELPQLDGTIESAYAQLEVLAYRFGWSTPEFDREGY